MRLYRDCEAVRVCSSHGRNFTTKHKSLFLKDWYLRILIYRLDTTAKAPLISARRGPYLSLCYLKTQGKLVTHWQPFIAVADIILYSALTQDSIKASAGSRDTIWVVEEKEGDQSLHGKSTRRRIEKFSKSMTTSFPSFTELKVVSEVFLELLLIWVSRRTFRPVQSICSDHAWSPPLSDGEAN